MRHRVPAPGHDYTRVFYVFFSPRSVPRFRDFQKLSTQQHYTPHAPHLSAPPPNDPTTQRSCSGLTKRLSMRGGGYDYLEGLRQAAEETGTW